MEGISLTAEQEEVVSIASGRHLVLAPPGSGKTEMLSQRILRALRSGTAPQRMLCATFTNRAAFEMRSRIAASGDGTQLPEVGNLHHFCHRFLRSVGRLSPLRHIIDDVEQLSFAKEVTEALRRELENGDTKGTSDANGVSVLHAVRGVVTDSAGTINTLRIRYLKELLEGYFAACAANDQSPYLDILSAILISHQRKIGIPAHFLRMMPPEMYIFDAEGVIGALSGVYSKLKRTFDCVDYDDLINEAYLYLEKCPLPHERQFDWIQIDEVQDLNPLQWRIVKGLTAPHAVSVYFGDVEQAIFSFLGASTMNFADSVSGCELHYFKNNFRATPLLLEILMRYSLDALRSEWAFLPEPIDVRRQHGRVRIEVDAGGGLALSEAKYLLQSGTAADVAILVRRNLEADELESGVRQLGYRYAKVSGIDLFSLAPMRDFMAFVTVVAGMASRTAWATIMRRFAAGVFTGARARHLVREMMASRFDPESLWGKESPVPSIPHPRSRRLMWAWRRRRELKSMRDGLRPVVLEGRALLAGKVSLRALFKLFLEIAMPGDGGRYSLRELWPERGGPRDATDPENRRMAHRHALERMEKFFRYADHVYAQDERTLGAVITEDWAQLTTLKEADLLVGDERIVISTIHKAKGRQFDAVVIPDAADVLSAKGDSPGEAERLLYVAMSRAKRHLAVFGWPNEPSCRRLEPCFADGYTGYYLQRDAGKDLSADWLFQWERLAAMNAAGKVDMEAVEHALSSTVGPLVRIALRALRHLSDLDVRRSRYHRILVDADSLPKDCFATLVGCVGDSGLFDLETLRLVREVALSAVVEDVWYSALRFFQIAAAMAGSRALAMSCMTDGLFNRSPALRMMAAQRLQDCGDSRWIRIVKGTHGDFDRLGVSSVAASGESIRIMVKAAEAAGDKAYARRLREMLAMAMGVK